jgi:hypothetical protein
MLIDDDPRYRTLLRHHISCAWPDVELVSTTRACAGR